MADGWRKKANAVLGSLKTLRKEGAFHSISGTSARRPLKGQGKPRDLPGVRQHPAGPGRMHVREGGRFRDWSPFLPVKARAPGERATKARQAPITEPRKA